MDAAVTFLCATACHVAAVNALAAWIAHPHMVDGNVTAAKTLARYAKDESQNMSSTMTSKMSSTMISSANLAIDRVAHNAVGYLMQSGTETRWPPRAGLYMLASAAAWLLPMVLVLMAFVLGLASGFSAGRLLATLGLAGIAALVLLGVQAIFLVVAAGHLRPVGHAAAVDAAHRTLRETCMGQPLCSQPKQQRYTLLS
jgi:hypothetical protein